MRREIIQSRLFAVAVLALVALVPEPFMPSPRTLWYVAPFAGDGVSGHRDGPKEQARFTWPTDMAVAPDWTVYVADFGNNLIRRIGSDGQITTLAGDGTAGYADGQGTAARFNGPNGLSLGPDGNIYVADAGNARIRRVTPGGSVTTVAGSGERGLRDGAAAGAWFGYPTGLAFDPDGALYVVDRWVHTVRRVTADGQVTTVAGNGTPGFVDGKGEGARFNNPLSAAWDPYWGLVVTDSGNHALRRVAPDGTVITLAGGPFPGSRDGSATQAEFFWDTGITSDGRGGLYVSDANNFRIRRISRSLHVSTVAGSGIQGIQDGAAQKARFAFITGLTLDPAGNLLVADSAAHRIRRVAPGRPGMAGGDPGWALAGQD